MSVDTDGYQDLST